MATRGALPRTARSSATESLHLPWLPHARTTLPPCPPPSLLEAEDDLVDAMRTADVDRLDARVAAWATFLRADGRTHTKADDLAARTGGGLLLERLTVLSRQHTEQDGVGQTTMIAHVTVDDHGVRERVTVSWTRHWELFCDRWLLVAAVTTMTH